MNIVLSLGPRDCGKSLFVEKKMSKYLQKLYFGTLRLDEKVCEIIEKHRARRDESWLLLETSGSLSEDFIEIYSSVTTYSLHAVLFDGLTNWVDSLIQNGTPPSGLPQLFANNLNELMRGLSYVDWYLINVTESDFRSNSCERRLITQFVNQYFCQADDVKIWSFDECGRLL